MKTQEDIHREINEIMRVLSEYRCLKRKQIICLFSNNAGDKPVRMIAKLIKQKYIAHDKENDMLSYGGTAVKKYSPALIKSFWVLLDFLCDTEYHLPSEYPVQIAFFMQNDIYEIILQDEKLLTITTM